LLGSVGLELTLERARHLEIQRLEIGTLRRVEIADGLAGYRGSPLPFGGGTLAIRRPPVSS